MRANPAPRKTPKQSAWSRWRPVALPTEHGGWSFIGEPIAVGLLVAFSLSGFFLAVAAVAVFLLRQPLKIALKDLMKKRTTPRTNSALAFSAVYGIVAGMAGIVVIFTAPNARFLVPLMMSLPLLAIQLYHDTRGRGRSLTAELCGAVAPGAITSALVLLDGGIHSVALVLWVAMAAKGIGAVIYVRARLRLERDQLADPAWWVVLIHVIGGVILLGLALVGLLSWGAVIGMGVLTVRAGVGLSSWRRPRPAKVIGFQEVGYGVLFVLLVVIGAWLR